MHYLNISFTHKNTDISVRERLAFDDGKKEEALRLICSNLSVSECLLLTTCNRVEVLAFVNNLEVAQSYILKVMSILSGVALNELEYRADIYHSNGAVHHLFSVASSLDSLVIGETQITGQLKDAMSFALDRNFAGDNLKRVVECSFRCAAEVRNKTEISKNPVSVSSVAVSKAREILEDLNGVTAVVVGAGHMSELACKHLLSTGANIIVVNRSEKSANDMISNLGSCYKDSVRYEPFSRLKEMINSHQLIFSATSAPGPVIVDSLIKEQNFQRYFFDIAVPRDIEIKESLSVKVYSVDDLQEIVKLNLALREEQAQIAYSVVARYTAEFFKWLKSLATTPIIKALRQSAKDVSEVEIKKAITRGYLKHSDIDEARKLIHQVFKAFLHTPTVNLKEIANGEDSDAAFGAIIEIFDIEDKFMEYSKGLEK